MTIMKTIGGLHNLGYVFSGNDGREHLAVLGCHSSPKSESYEWAENIISISYAMQDLYSKTDSSDNDKSKLARLMQKMHSMCETRKIGLFTIDEQEKYLQNRTDSELKQIELQVKMHLDCRNFYREYLYR